MLKLKKSEFNTYSFFIVDYTTIGYGYLNGDGFEFYRYRQGFARGYDDKIFWI